MSAHKRELSRRLKAADSSNRQLRAELRELRAGRRSGPDSRVVSSQLSPMADTPSSAVRGKSTCLSNFSIDIASTLTHSYQFSLST